MRDPDLMEHALAERVLEPVRMAAMTLRDLEAVLQVEQRSYGQPWTRRNFADSLDAGCHAQCLWQAGTLVGYLVAVSGVEEAHLLKCTVAPDWRRQGWARVLLEALVLWARAGGGARSIWLEVRADNQVARTLYRCFGFEEVGLRKAYYPVGRGRRQDAVLMTLVLEENRS